MRDKRDWRCQRQPLQTLMAGQYNELTDHLDPEDAKVPTLSAAPVLPASQNLEPLSFPFDWLKDFVAVEGP